MIAEARKKELVFNTLTLDEYQGSTAPYGRIYNSRSAFGAYYRYDPRFLNPPRDRQGSVIPTLKIHETVVWRIAAGTDGYAPFNLPSDFKVVSGGFLPRARIWWRRAAEVQRRGIFILSRAISALYAQTPSVEGWALPEGMSEMKQLI